MFGIILLVGRDLSGALRWCKNGKKLRIEVIAKLAMLIGRIEEQMQLGLESMAMTEHYVRSIQSQKVSPTR